MLNSTVSIWEHFETIHKSKLEKKNQQSQDRSLRNSL